MKATEQAPFEIDEHSGRSRVTPAFTRLQANGGPAWAAELLRLADGIQAPADIGPIVSISIEKERTVPPGSERLAWMIRNAHLLSPVDGRRWREYRSRVIDNPRKEDALRKLDSGQTGGIDPKLKLEGPTHADCLIECTQAFVWIEGKRNDWLSPSIEWDVSRDQLARNLDAAWRLSKEEGKDFWLIICHERDLKHHERELVDGYRAGTWKAGFPHLTNEIRAQFMKKIGTLRWQQIFEHWPDLFPEFLQSASPPA
jgi:hypothetical protein